MCSWCYSRDWRNFNSWFASGWFSWFSPRPSTITCSDIPLPRPHLFITVVKSNCQHTPSVRQVRVREHAGIRFNETINPNSLRDYYYPRIGTVGTDPIINQRDNRSHWSVESWELSSLWWRYSESDLVLPQFNFNAPFANLNEISREDNSHSLGGNVSIW